MATANDNASVFNKLPVGIQDFESLRRDGYLYVDKTEYLIRLIDNGKAYFLSRPRRFGKSLTISTFEALFSGKRDLFTGLYAEEFFSRPDYAVHPVLHLDMSKVVTDAGRKELESSLFDQLEICAIRYKIVLEEVSPARALSRLIFELHRLHGAVAVLVDEYDKPILDVIENTEQARENRALLRSFYAQIKANDAYIRFVFMTGISKFTKTGVFSAMNNLYDLSADSAYSQMMGYTEQELMDYFQGDIAGVAESLGVSKIALADHLRAHYDGFSFDGVTRVYNPFSTLCFFRMKKFQNFWFDSGQSSFVASYIKKHSLNPERLRGKEVYENFTAAHEIENAEPESFLFQAGYLTLRERHHDGWRGHGRQSGGSLQGGKRGYHRASRGALLRD